MRLGLTKLFKSQTHLIWLLICDKKSVKAKSLVLENINCFFWNPAYFVKLLWLFRKYLKIVREREVKSKEKD